MEQKTARYLNWYYYGMMVLTLICATAMYFLLTRGVVAPIDRFSTLGKVIQYIIIFDALITIPGGLYGFKYLNEKVKTIEDEVVRFSRYRTLAAIRIVLVSNAMPLGVVAYYLLGIYPSMIWVAAIAAIGWYFTKPTARKIQIEMTVKLPGQEDY